MLNENFTARLRDVEIAQKRFEEAKETLRAAQMTAAQEASPFQEGERVSGYSESHPERVGRICRIEYRAAKPYFKLAVNPVKKNGEISGVIRYAHRPEKLQRIKENPHE